MQTDNNLGYDEVVDTIVDLIQIGRTVGDALADGLDLTDVTAVFSIAPRLVEVYRDANTAYAQLLDLTTGEASLAVAEIAEHAQLPATGILGKVNEALNLLSRTYQEVVDGIDLAQDWRDWVVSLKPTDTADAADS